MSSRNNEGSQPLNDSTTQQYISMKNKLHTVCHPELVIPSEVEGSHYTNNHVTSSLSRSHFQTFLFSMLYALCSIPATAQPYQWQWALNGGSSGAGVSGSSWHIYAEQIYDIAIDKNNNYYFVASIAGSNPQLNGQSVIVYSNIATNNDIFLFSTTCDGQVRWSQAIGGGAAFDRAFKIALDSNNNVYVGASVMHGSVNYPVHFSPTETLPGPPATPTTVSDYFKSTFLVKYDTNGQFIWKRALQGDVTNDNSYSSLNNILIDSNDNIHFIVGLLSGTHLNNTVTVPSQYNASDKLKYYLVRYSSSGQLTGSIALPIDYGSQLIDPYISFRWIERIK